MLCGLEVEGEIGLVVFRLLVVHLNGTECCWVTNGFADGSGVFVKIDVR